MKAAVSPLSAAFLAFLTSSAFADVSPWGQCGGNNYSGDTTCTSGHTCVVVNEWYHQCQPGSAPPTSTTSPPPSTTSSPVGTVCPLAVTKFTYFGVNQAGAEFGSNVVPGELGTHYTWPEPSSIDFFVNERHNTFRIPFQLERLNPPAQGLTGAFNQAYLDGLKTTVNYITNKGAYAIIEPHNYMRYSNATITNTSQFATWWRNLANEFKDNDRVIFDIMNEPHTMDAKVVFDLNQAALDAIRAAGATRQLVLVEGTSWTGAWTWTTTSGNGDVFQNIRDPNNNVAIEMHQYLDSDGSGTSPTCVSSTIARERFTAATAWLKQHNLKGFLGEIGAGSNTACIEAVRDGLCSLLESGVWVGVTWWAAGPWWGNYFQSIEPPNGPSLAEMYPTAIKPFI